MSLRLGSGRSGQSLVELLVGIALGVLFIIGAATIIAPSLQIGKETAQVQTKTELADEMLDNVKAWAAGDWNNVLALATGTANTYYLNTNSSPFGVTVTSTIILSTTTAAFGKFTLGTSGDDNTNSMYFKAASVPVSNGAITSITWSDFGCSSACSNNYLGVALYTDNSGSPGTLIASSTTIASQSLIASGGYGTSTVAITANVTAGMQYWFAVADATQSSTDLQYQYPSTSAANSFYCGTAGACESGGSTFPTSASGGGSLFPEQPYIYATYTYNTTSTESSSYSTSTESILINGITYARYFYLSDVYRDSNGNVTTTASGNNYDPSTKLVTVVVNASGTNPGPTSTLSFYLTRNGSNYFNQTSWAGSSGQGGPLTIANSGYATSTYVNIAATGSIQLTPLSSISFIQSCQFTAFGNSAGCTLGSNVSSSDVLVAAAYTNSTNALSVTGCGVTWTQVASGTGGGDYSYIYTAPDPSGGACTASSSFTGITSYIGIDLWDLSGASTQVDTSTIAGASFCTTGCSTPPITTTANGDAVLAAIFTGDTGQTYSTVSYATDFNGLPSGGYEPTLAAHTSQLKAGLASMTYQAGSSDNEDQIVFALESASSSPHTNGYVASGTLESSTFDTGGSVSNATILFVQSTSTSPFLESGGSLAFANNVAKGDLILLGVNGRDGDTLTAADTLGDTFVQVGASSYSGNSDSEVFVATTSALGPDTVTVNDMTGNGLYAFSIHEYSGTAIDSIADIIDASSSNYGGCCGLGLSTGNITTNYDNDLIFAYFINDDDIGDNTFDYNPLYTRRELVPGEVNFCGGGGAANCIASEDTILSSAGTVNATTSMASGDGWGAVGLAIKARPITVSQGAQLNYFSWQGSTPPNTSVGFQFAVHNSPNGTWSFEGPDGTPNTYFSGPANTPISLVGTIGGYTLFSGYRYYRYLVTLFASSTNLQTPTVSQVTVNWSP